jgi:hypothetical protein
MLLLSKSTITQVGRKFKEVGFFLLTLLLVPQITFGASASLCQNITDFKSAIGCALGALSLVVPLLIGFALLAFLYGLLLYVTEGASSEGRTKASQFIVYGTIGLFVMISVYGLVSVLLNTFAFSGSGGSAGGASGIYSPYYNSQTGETGGSPYIAPQSGETGGFPYIPPQSSAQQSEGGAFGQ